MVIKKFSYFQSKNLNIPLIVLLIFTTTIKSQQPPKYKNYKDLEEAYTTFKENKNLEKASNIARIYYNNAYKQKNQRQIILGLNMLSKAETDLSKKMLYTEKMVLVARKYQPELLGFSLYQRGVVFENDQKYKKALNLLIEANKITDKSKQKKLHHSIQNEIAVIKSILGHYKEALPIFLENYKVYSNSTKFDLRMLYNISECYSQLDSIDLSNQYLQKGYDIAYKTNQKKWINRFNYCKGLNLFKKNQLISSYKLLKSTLESSKKNQDLFQLSSTYYYLGQINRKLSDKKKATFYFEKIDSLFNKGTPLLVENHQIYSFLIKQYKNKENLSKQHYYIDQLLKADSLVKEDYQFFSNKIHREYDIPKALNPKKKIINELTDQKKTSKFVILILSICFILICISFFLFRRKQKKLLLEQKAKFDEFIKKQTKEKRDKTPTQLSHKNSQIPQLDISKEIVEEVLQKMDQFEREHHFIEKELTLDKLSKSLETNTSYLSKIINHFRGTNFTTYINSLRIEYALDKIQNDPTFRKFSIKGIADSVGFKTAESFSKSFTKKTGIRPSFFIKELEKKGLDS